MPAEVLVLGAGFAGLAAANELARLRDPRRFRVTVLDRRREAVFAPLLPDLISGRVTPRHLSYPIEDHCRRIGVAFRHGNVREIDLASGRVATFEGDLRADFIILCLGCDTNYFGLEDAKTRCLGLKWIEEGLTIRRRAAAMLGLPDDGGCRDKVAAMPARPAECLVIGGGYTGFEAASHLAHFVHCRTGLPFDRIGRAAHITILEKLDEVLTNVPRPVRQWARTLLEGYGVTIRTGATIDRFLDEDRIALTDGSVVDRPLVLWTAGVKPPPPVEALETPRVRGARLAVDPYLRLPGRGNAFAAGDVAGPVPEGHKEPLRMAVQFSLSGGRAAARNVVRSITGNPLVRYAPLDPGYVVPLAPGKAAGTVLGLEMKGLVPYALHYFMSVYRAWGWRNRFGIMADLAGASRKGYAK